jgi:excisionase family DNA binding protein
MEQHYSYMEIAERLGMPISTLYLYKKQGTGPNTKKVGRHFRVSETDLNNWLDSRRD